MNYDALISSPDAADFLSVFVPVGQRLSYWRVYRLTKK